MITLNNYNNKKKKKQKVLYFLSKLFTLTHVAGARLYQRLVETCTFLGAGGRGGDWEWMDGFPFCTRA